MQGTGIRNIFDLISDCFTGPKLFPLKIIIWITEKIVVGWGQVRWEWKVAKSCISYEVGMACLAVLALVLS